MFRILIISKIYGGMISFIASEVQWHFHDLKLWDNTFFETPWSCRLYEVIKQWKPDEPPDGFLFLHGCAASFLISCLRNKCTELVKDVLEALWRAWTTPCQWQKTNNLYSLQLPQTKPLLCDIWCGLCYLRFIYSSYLYIDAPIISSQWQLIQSLTGVCRA